MKIAIESTTKIVTLQINGANVPARVWEGATETGTPVHCFITRIAPTIDRNDPRQEEFVAQLQECAAPSTTIDAIPLRLIL